MRKKSNDLEDLGHSDNNSTELFQISAVQEQKLTNPFKQIDITLHVIVHIAEEEGERPGCLKDLECKGMNDALVAMKNEETGRVLLSNFYGDTLDGGK